MIWMVLLALLAGGGGKKKGGGVRRGPHKKAGRLGLRKARDARDAEARRLALEQGVPPEALDAYMASGAGGKAATGDYAGAALDLAVQNEGALDTFLRTGKLPL